MDKVSVFESSDFGEIRVMVINDQPWFVGSDIASALGYSNASKAVSAHVDEEDIDRILLTDLERFTQNGKSRINNSKVMIINESGVYSLILSSKLDSAKKFKKWVTSEVLPSIRKTGEYKTSSGGKKRPHQPTNIPSGAVFCGLRHCSIISQFAAYGIAHKNRSVQGFLTSKNRFLTREEASELVKNNNQEMVVDRSAIREQLYSEDLY